MRKRRTGENTADARPDHSRACLEHYLDVAPALLGLTIEPSARASVMQHLQATADAAQLVLDFDIGDGIEPAPVFRA